MDHHFLIQKPAFNKLRKSVSEAQRKTRTVYDAFNSVIGSNGQEIRAGQVVAFLRESNDPFGSWEVRGELSKLEALGLLKLNGSTGTWSLVDGIDYDEAVADPQ